MLNTLGVATILVGVALAGVQLGCTNNVILSNQEIKVLLAHARTSEDHVRLAAHYRAKAAAYESDAKQHEELAAYYKGSGSFESNDHCEVLVLANRNAVTQARALAASHEQLAGLAGK